MNVQSLDIVTLEKERWLIRWNTECGYARPDEKQKILMCCMWRGNAW